MAAEPPPVRRSGAVSWFIVGAATLLAVALGAGSWAGYHYWWVDWKTQSYRQACEEARDAENWRALERIAGDWAAWDPDHGQAWLYRALAARNQNEVETAAEYFGRVPPEDPKALDAYMMKARYELDLLNQPFKGLETCRRIIEINPDVLQAHARLISFYAMTLQRPKMLEAIRRAVESGAEPKEAYVYLILSDDLVFTNAIDHMTRWLSAHPDAEVFRVGLAVHQAQLRAMEFRDKSTEEAERRRAEAMQRLRDLLETYPHNPVLLGYLLQHHKDAGNVEEVGRLLRQVDEEGARDYMMWIYRGWYQASRGRLERAKEAYQRALELNPLSCPARQEYAALLRQLQRPDEVQRMQQLASEGRELRQQLQQLQTARKAGVEEFQEIASYMAKCGESQLADALQRRIAQMTGRTPAIRMPGTSPGFGAAGPGANFLTSP